MRINIFTENSNNSAVLIELHKMKFIHLLPTDKLINNWLFIDSGFLQTSTHKKNTYRKIMQINCVQLHKRNARIKFNEQTWIYRKCDDETSKKNDFFFCQMSLGERVYWWICECVSMYVYVFRTLTSSNSYILKWQKIIQPNSNDMTFEMKTVAKNHSVIWFQAIDEKSFISCSSIEII